MIQVAVLALGVFFSSPSAEDVQNVVAETFEGGLYQNDFPGIPERDPTEDWDRTPRAPPDASGLQVIVRGLLWVGVAIIVVLLLIWAFQSFVDPRRPPPNFVDDPDVPEAVVLTNEPLDDATALAAQGRYGDAIHALLLRTLATLSTDRSLPKSWTSREVVAGTRLSDAAREGLVELVDATELSLFGGRTADRIDYEHCVQSFRRLQATLEGASA